MFDCCVIGGGIVGLSTAWWLARSGVDVTIVEKSHRVGGRTATLEQDGYKFDIGIYTIRNVMDREWSLVAE